MASLKDISVVVEGVVTESRAIRSGEKYVTPQGFTAIKDGQKQRAGTVPAPATGRKPAWIRAQLPVGAGFGAVKGIVHEHRLATVCEEAKCPNIGECWNAGTATIMLMGAVCTRACRFCSVDTGNPRGWLDAEEPENTARSVELMKLKYIVLTSVNRDDLPDGGAGHYASAIRAIKRRTPHVAVEALTPDFQGVLRDVETVVDSGLEVFAQNVETVKRLTHPVRDARASYEQTLAVLEHAKKYKPEVLTKTSLMLGLGETDEEIAQTMDDLRAVNVDLLTLGQYLRPTVHHLEVQRFVTPAEFDQYREWALAKGFRECVAGPLVRSSYRAEQALAGNNAGQVRSDAILSKWGRDSGKLGTANSTCVKAGLSRNGARHPRRRPSVKWLGRVDYEPTWREMQRITDTRDENTPDEIWLLEHPPVFTLGLNADASHVLAAGRHPRREDRSRRAGDLSRPRPARGLSTHRHPPRGSWRARPRDRARARRDRLLQEPRNHRRVPQERAGCVCRWQEDRERRPAHPPRRQLSRPRVQREHGSRAVQPHQSLWLCRPADDAARRTRFTGRERRVRGTGVRAVPAGSAGAAPHQG